MKDIKERQLTVTRDADVVVIWVGKRRVLRFPLGAAEEFAGYMDSTPGDSGPRLCATDEGFEVEVYHNGGHIHVQKARRVVCSLRPGHAMYLAQAVREAMRPKDTSAPPPSTADETDTAPRDVGNGSSAEGDLPADPKDETTSERSATPAESTTTSTTTVDLTRSTPAATTSPKDSTTSEKGDVEREPADSPSDAGSIEPASSTQTRQIRAISPEEIEARKPKYPSDEKEDIPYRQQFRSHTQLTSFNDCGYKYKLQRVDRVSVRPSWSFIGGRAIHRMIEAFEKKTHYARSQNRNDFWPDGDWSRRKFTTMLMDEIQAAVNKAPEEHKDPDTWSVANKNTEDMKWWLRNGPDFAERYADMNPSNRTFMTLQTAPGVLALEMKFYMDWGGVIQYGLIDQITVDNEGVLDVIDMKSGRSLPSDRGLQVITAAHWVAQMFPDCEVRGGSYYDLRKGVLSRNYKRSEIPEEACAYAYQQMDAAEKAGIYMPRVSNYCSSCFVKSACVFGGDATQLHVE